MFRIEHIWKYLKTTFSKKDAVIFFVLISVFFATRIIHLTQWPIFSDEGIYIRWAKTAWKDASWRFISVTDGRQPLQTWGTIPFLKLFPDNALLAGRLFSVTTGFVAFAGMMSLTFTLWGKKAGYIAGLLHLFIPYFLFYDRMALVDSAVNAGFIWILFFSILLAKSRRFDVAFLMGFIGGFASLAKSSTRIFLLLSATAPILYLHDLRSKKFKKFFLESASYLVLLLGVICITLLFYNVQRLSPYFHYVAIKNTTFIRTFDEFIADPLGIFWHNIKILPLYISWESGWLIVPLSIFGLYTLIKNDRYIGVYLLFWFVVPAVGITLMAKVLFPRYVIFYGSLFVVTAAYGLGVMHKKMVSKKISLSTLILGIVLLSMMILDIPLLFFPAKASFPPVDRGQYIEGLTAVWGAQDLVEELRVVSTNEHESVIVLAEGDFGLVADVLRVFVNESDAIEIRGHWPLDETELFQAMHEAETKRVFVVFSHKETFPDHWPIVLVQKYSKPNSDKALYLFEIKPNALSCEICNPKNS